MNSTHNKTFVDIYNGVFSFRLYMLLAWFDIRQRYRRSIVGPFWITLTTLVMVLTIGTLFGRLFNTELSYFLPYLACGLIYWTFILTTLQDSCVSFITAESVIKQLPIPLMVHILRGLVRNFIILIHNFILIPLILLYFDINFLPNIVYFIIGNFLLVLNLFWISIIFAIICTRFRDVQPIISNVLQVVFYITPIMWVANQVPAREVYYFTKFNPFYYLINIVRAPLVDPMVQLQDYYISSLVALLGSSCAIFLFSTTRKKIPYWL